MSIQKILYTGVSGLMAHGEGLGVVGDNIANVNTTGYKTERAVFADLLGHSMMATNQSGSGVRLDKITRTFSQGSLVTTESPTDLAVNGQGFFIVNGNVGGISGNFYSRAGQFSLDRDGTLVNPQGMALQGYLVDSTGAVDNQMTDLKIANSVLPPTPSTAIEIAANLDSTEVSPAAFDPASPGTTSNFSTAITVYDSLGAAHRTDVYFRKSAANSWEWHALVDGGELTGGTAGVPTETAAGTLGFTPDGLLDTETVTTAPDFDFIDATQNQAIEFDFGDSITTDGGTGDTGVTQYASSSSIRNQTQDGFSTGELVGVGVLNGGEVMALYSNGEQQQVGQVAMATFAADTELARAGDSLWAKTQDSGDARIGAPSTGANGSITSGALEQSTVDLAEEFVKMIAYQRGFQANSRTITTVDQLYQELVNLKR
ncbi:MAG: flagellar hook protein FlgE [Deltaproteobacteria bacterium]|nr:flagellar hook protein FlgE [Deltaproteobacteria bacterium]